MDSRFSENEYFVVSASQMGNTIIGNIVIRNNT